MIRDCAVPLSDRSWHLAYNFLFCFLRQPLRCHLQATCSSSQGRLNFSKGTKLVIALPCKTSITVWILVSLYVAKSRLIPSVTFGVFVKSCGSFFTFFRSQEGCR